MTDQSHVLKANADMPLPAGRMHTVDVTIDPRISSAAEVPDPGQHYRHSYRVYLTVEDIGRGYVELQLDPFRIAKIYRMTSFALQTVLKKCLKAGDRGHKDKRQDLRDIISAAERELQIMDEDERNEVTAEALADG